MNTHAYAVALALAWAAWAEGEETHHAEAHQAASPTQALAHEHEVIEQVVEALDRMSTQFERDGKLDTASATDVVTFLRDFADKCHHAKEERYLFPALDGTPQQKLAAELLKEHDRARGEVKAMDAAIKKGSAAEFAAHGHAYTKLLRRHIEKENKDLFPQASHTLSPDAQQKLAEAFERVEAEEMGQGTHERFVGIAERLAERYDVPQSGAKAEAHAH